MTISPDLIDDRTARDSEGRRLRIVDRREEFSQRWASLFPSGRDASQPAQNERVKIVSLLMDR